MKKNKTTKERERDNNLIQHYERTEQNKQGNNVGNLLLKDGPEFHPDFRAEKFQAPSKLTVYYRTASQVSELMVIAIKGCLIKISFTQMSRVGPIHHYIHN